MDFQNIYSLIDLIVLAFGFYALYAAYVLRTDGKIIDTFLIFKDTTADSCRDLQGFANYMSPKLITLGGIMIVYSGTSLVNTYLVPIGTLCLVMAVIFMLALVWYAMAIKKAAKLFFE